MMSIIRAVPLTSYQVLSLLRAAYLLYEAQTFPHHLDCLCAIMILQWTVNTTIMVEFVSFDARQQQASKTRSYPLGVQEQDNSLSCGMVIQHVLSHAFEVTLTEAKRASESSRRLRSLTKSFLVTGFSSRVTP
jgi:hypothetical protein